MGALISAPDLDPFALISSQDYRIVREGSTRQRPGTLSTWHNSTLHSPDFNHLMADVSRWRKASDRPLKTEAPE